MRIYFRRWMIWCLLLALCAPCAAMSEEADLIQLTGESEWIADDPVSEIEVDLETDEMMAAEAEDVPMEAKEVEDPFDEGERAVAANVPPTGQPNASSRKEVSGYIGKNATTAANALSLNQVYADQYADCPRTVMTFANSESKPVGSENWLTHQVEVICVDKYNWTINAIEEEYLPDSQYTGSYPSLTLCGVYCGMPFASAEAALLARGWKIQSSDGYAYGYYENGAGLYYSINCSETTSQVRYMCMYDQRYKAYIDRKDTQVNLISSAKASGISLDRSGTITIGKGEMLALVPSVNPANALQDIKWSTSKYAVCEVIEGVLRAKSEGTAKITAKTANGKKATVKVKVVDPYKPTGVKISQGKKAAVNMGQTLQLKTALTPSTARATLKWKSSKPKVATVSSSGLVTPVSEGKTKITVTTQNKKKAIITVQVVDPEKPKSVKITQGKTYRMKVGQTLQLNAVLSPETAKSALTWKSKKTKVATVDANGLVLAKAPGTVKITVSTYNKKKATITIKVSK